VLFPISILTNTDLYGASGVGAPCRRVSGESDCGCAAPDL